MFLLFLLFAGRLLAVMNVWIDTDAAIGAPWREVDDAYALILAFHSPQLHIVGVSSTYGNAGLPRTTAVTRDIVRRFGATARLEEQNVAPGARHAEDFVRSSEATEALARALQAKRLTYVALGPLTNLAALLRMRPELATRIDKVIFVGGGTPGPALAFGRRGKLRIHDANVFKDAAAARIVMGANLPVVLAPIETGMELLLTRDDAQQLSVGGESARFLQRGSRVWLWFWTGVVGNRGGPLFDALAVIAAANPDTLAIEKRSAAVLSSGELIAARRSFRGGHTISFCAGVCAGAKRTLMHTLLRDPMPLERMPNEWRR